MKVICVNVSNSKKQTKEKIAYTSLNLKQSNNNFWELTIPLNHLNKRVFEQNKGLFKKSIGYFWDRKLISIIKSKEKDVLYILPKALDKDFEKDTAFNLLKSHIMVLMDKAGIERYTYSGNIKENIFSYVNTELKKQNVEFNEAKLLLLYENSKNVDLKLIEDLAKNYKIIDVLCKNIEDGLLNKKIDEINNTLGTSITVRQKITKKDLKVLQFNLSICMDANKNKFNITNMSVLDLSDNDIDKYDKYVVLANKNKLYKNINTEYLTYMTKNYGRLKILSLLCKMENLA